MIDIKFVAREIKVLWLNSTMHLQGKKQKNKLWDISNKGKQYHMVKWTKPWRMSLHSQGFVHYIAWYCSML